MGSRAAGLLPWRSPLIFHSPPVAPFRDPLPRLPVWTGEDVTVTATAGRHRFHSSLPPSPSFGYGGLSYLGPVIEARSGVPTTLRFRNALAGHVFARDVDTTVHGATELDRVAPRGVVHLHGGVTPPRFDGHPEATVRPGQEFVHVYPNRQEAAALWYHDHAIGITRLNVYAGLASMYVLRDRWDTGRADNPLGLPAGEFEIPLLLQEKIFTADGAQSVRSTPIVPEGSWEGGAVGDVGVVNGTAWPELDVARGLYRFRIVNAGSFSVWNLFFGNRMRFWVIGNDGGLLDAPVATTSVKLAPAERVDLLVDFRGRVPRTLRGGRGQPPRLPPVPVPERVRNLTISQPFEWRLPPSVMVLDNLEFTTTDIETPRQGVVEQWNLIDVTPDPHPIHVHLVTFRILGRQPFDVDAYTRRFPQPAVGTRWTPPADDVVTGPLDPPAPWEAGAKDTVRADGGTITRIVVRFPTAGELGFDPDETFAPPGRTAAHEAGDDAGHEPAELQGYVWHCHVLDHEDHDMMLRYRLLP